MSNILLVIAALTGAQAWTAWAYMGVHGGEYLVSEHTALVVQCNEEREEILVTVHVPHDEEDGRAVLKHRTLYVQMDGERCGPSKKRRTARSPGCSSSPRKSGSWTSCSTAAASKRFSTTRGCRSRWTGRS